MCKTSYLLVNFGGPRHLGEVEEFLIELLCDQSVIRTPLPAWLHRLFFTRVAKKRAVHVAKDYARIGGKSPIFEDTQRVASRVGALLDAEVLTFHRYLPQTHPLFLEQMAHVHGPIHVVPMFPQFSTATTGSIMQWFKTHLPKELTARMHWVRSYHSHPLYIAVLVSVLRKHLEYNKLQEEEVCLLFSAHGLPQQFIDTGDPYQQECENSFSLVKAHFPAALSLLSYQSQFGKQPWIRPYTSEVCAQIARTQRPHIVVVPLSFTSDHIETLYEVEYLYLEAIRAQGLKAYRCPALNLEPQWIATVAALFQEAGAVK